MGVVTRDIVLYWTIPYVLQSAPIMKQSWNLYQLILRELEIFWTKWLIDLSALTNCPPPDPFCNFFTILEPSLARKVPTSVQCYCSFLLERSLSSFFFESATQSKVVEIVNSLRINTAAWRVVQYSPIRWCHRHKLHRWLSYWTRNINNNYRSSELTNRIRLCIMDIMG